MNVEITFEDMELEVVIETGDTEEIEIRDIIDPDTGETVDPDLYDYLIDDCEDDIKELIQDWFHSMNDDCLIDNWLYNKG